MSHPVDFTPALISWRMSLDQARARIASNNIANVDTNGFVPQRLNFAAELSRLQAAAADPETLRDALAGVQAEGFTTVAETPNSLLGSPVNLDQEIASMVSANTDYQSMVEGLNRYFSLLHLAITSQE